MENKVVLVTGSSRGIGRATIIEFAKKGYNVVINYIDSEKEAKLKFIDGNFEFNNEEDAKKLKEYVEKQYEIQAMIVEMDVSNEAEIKNGIKKIIDRFGKIDVLVNCAGIVFDRDIYKATINSLNITIIGIHAGKCPNSTNIIIAAMTTILSAIGSKNFPNVVI